MARNLIEENNQRDRDLRDHTGPYAPKPVPDINNPALGPLGTLAHHSRNLPTPPNVLELATQAAAPQPRAATVANLAHEWAVPAALVKRLVCAEANIFLLEADLRKVLDLLQRAGARLE